jgi:hypothetical protein
MNNFNRRHFLGALAAASARGSRADTLPPVRAITKGPKFHWFGYYDKLQFDPTSRYALGMEVGFEHRSPTADDRIRIGMVDLKDNDRWIDLGETRAWCWQQGCMLQWLPGSSDEVIYNDRGDGHYISHILNVKTGKRRTLPGPIYALSPDAKWSVSTDFSRLADTRPGYGYAGIPDRYKDVLAPEQTGIWRMDLATGKQKLIITYAQVAAIPYKIGDWTGSKHKFNHLLVSPDGSRFIFLHRRRGVIPNPKAGITRMFTANPDGTDLYVLDPYGDTSHFIWRRGTHVMAWANHPSHGHKFYIYKDRSEEVDVIGPDVMTVNGHNTYLRDYRWILNDTYPDKDRLQHPYLYDTETGKRYPLGQFVSPPEYTGEWRCDNHPRSSPDGRKVVIDSPHGGGRQMYLIEIGGIAG